MDGDFWGELNKYDRKFGVFERRWKRSIRRDINGIAATELVTTWAVSRIEDISKELIRQSEYGTIKGVKTSSGDEHAASYIPIKEVYI